MRRKVKHKSPAVAWESYIRAECRFLRKQGRCDVRKNWEAPKVKGHVRLETSAPDFGGCAIVNGRAVSVLIEAKRVDGHRLPLSRISNDQKKDLTLRHELGGLSIVYILSADDTKHVVRWLDFEPEILNKRGGSIPLDDRSKKRDDETWLDFIERRWDV